MAVAWPGLLQSVVNEDSFSYDFGSTLLRSSNDIGPDKVRRVSTRPIDNLTVSINLTVAEFSVFKTFHNTTLNGGVSPFTFSHPITGVETVFRFTKEPSVRSLGGGNFRVTMAWEIL